MMEHSYIHWGWLTDLIRLKKKWNRLAIAIWRTAACNRIILARGRFNIICIMSRCASEQTHSIPFRARNWPEMRDDWWRQIAGGWITIAANRRRHSAIKLNTCLCARVVQNCRRRPTIESKSLSQEMNHTLNTCTRTVRWDNNNATQGS